MFILSRLNENACSSKQKWNQDECWCECKELDDWGSCKDDYMWNPSRCGCECIKVYQTDEYLDVKISSCKKSLLG